MVSAIIQLGKTTPFSYNSTDKKKKRLYVKRIQEAFSRIYNGKIPKYRSGVELYGQVYFFTSEGTDLDADNRQTIADCDSFIESCSPFYDPVRHESITTNPHTGRTYKTLPTKVRNHIDHPSTAAAFTPGEMEESIRLMREILIHVP